MKIYDANGAYLNDSTVLGSSLFAHFSGLSLYSNYSLKVRAFTRKGFGPCSSLVNVSTGVPGKQFDTDFSSCLLDFFCIVSFRFVTFCFASKLTKRKYLKQQATTILTDFSKNTLACEFERCYCKYKMLTLNGNGFLFSSSQTNSYECDSSCYRRFYNTRGLESSLRGRCAVSSRLPGRVLSQL